MMNHLFLFMRLFNTKVYTVRYFLYDSLRAIMLGCQFSVFTCFIMFDFEPNLLSNDVVYIMNILIVILLHPFFAYFKRRNYLRVNILQQRVCYFCIFFRQSLIDLILVGIETIEYNVLLQHSRPCKHNIIWDALSCFTLASIESEYTFW